MGGCNVGWAIEGAPWLVKSLDGDGVVGDRKVWIFGFRMWYLNRERTEPSVDERFRVAQKASEGLQVTMVGSRIWRSKVSQDCGPLAQFAENGNVLADFNGAIVTVMGSRLEQLKVQRKVLGQIWARVVVYGLLRK